MVLPAIGERAKGVFQELEQLNLVGKRSGEGFVSHKSTMVNALSRGLADRLLLMDFTIGRKGLLNCIRSLSGSNVVKIVPSANGSASEERAADKRLKVVCGAFTTYLDDGAWINDKTGYSLADVRISPANTLTPNVGSTELAEAINRALTFTATDDTRPVLQCVMFHAGDGKLRLISADGFRLAVVALDYEHQGDEVKVLVNRADLKGIASALRKAKRVRVTFDKAGDDLTNMAVYIDTEVARYKLVGSDGIFPNYDAVIPTEFICHAQLDTAEVLKAVLGLKATAEDARSYAVDLTVGGGHMIMSHPDNEKGEVIVKADSGDDFGHVRLDGGYIADVMRVFGEMVDFSLSKAYQPVMFTANGFQVVVMPMMSTRSHEERKADSEASRTEAEGEGEPTAVVEAESTVEAETEPSADAETGSTAETEPSGEVETGDSTEPAEPEAKPKRSRSRKREPVAVA